MRTPGRVNVMISAIPTELRHVQPSFQLDVHFKRLHTFWYGDVQLLLFIFWSTTHSNQVDARRQIHMLAIRPIDLRLEEKVGIFIRECRSSGGQWIYAS